MKDWCYDRTQQEIEERGEAEERASYSVNVEKTNNLVFVSFILFMFYFK